MFYRIRYTIPAWKASQLLQSSLILNLAPNLQRELYFSDSTITFSQCLAGKTHWKTTKAKIVKRETRSGYWRTFTKCEILHLEENPSFSIDSIIKSTRSRFWKTTGNAELHESHVGERGRCGEGVEAPEWWFQIYCDELPTDFHWELFLDEFIHKQTSLYQHLPESQNETLERA